MLVSAHTAGTTPPKPAVVLGGAGALPFVALAIVACIAPEDIAVAATDAVIAYGAVILSFIGGAHWGFASGRMAGDRGAAARRLLLASVVPSLIAWGAVLLPTPWSAAILAVAFVAVLALDRWARARSLAPRWWMRLRLPLSATVAAALVVTGVAAMLRFAP